MNVPVEITIKISNSERSLKVEHLIYESFSPRQDDPILSQLVKEAKEDFKEPVDKILLTMKMQWD